MNANNVRTAVAIMRRAALHNCIDMVRYQWGDIPEDGRRYVAETEEQLHACGNTACFAGYVAVSPEWKAAGGYMYHNGEPKLPGGPNKEDMWALPAIAAWLGVDVYLAERLVLGDITYGGAGEGNYSVFYGKRWGEVDAHDVIEKLELILSGELV